PSQVIYAALVRLLLKVPASAVEAVGVLEPLAGVAAALGESAASKPFAEAPTLREALLQVRPGAPPVALASARDGRGQGFGSLPSRTSAPKPLVRKLRALVTRANASCVGRGSACVAAWRGCGCQCMLAALLVCRA